MRVPRRTEAQIVSPMPAGSGAILVHRQLEAHLPGYRVVPYSPLRELFPPSIGLQMVGPAELVHTTPDHAIFLARRGKRLVVTFHNVVVDGFMRPYSSAWQRLHYATDLRWSIERALRRAEAVTAVSQFTAALARSEFGYAGPVTVIPNGVDTSLFSPATDVPPSGTVRVLFAGNPTLRKGAHWLGAIAERLPAGVELVCATGLRGRGIGPLSERKNVRVIGKVSYPEMAGLYRSCHVFLLPSVREGMSLALLEAMACGLPAVASDTSSNPELVHPERGGYLCPVGDVDAFVVALGLLAESPERRARMGAYNRRLIEANHSLSRMVSAYASVFESLMD